MYSPNPKLINAVSDRFNRQTVPAVSYSRDFDELISQYDQNKLLGYSRGLYYNNPVVQRSIEQKAQYAIGSAFQYRSNTTDETAKAIFDEAITQWSAICEVSGMNLNDLAYLLSVKLDTDGDVAILLTQSTQNNYPQLKLIEAHSIGSRIYGKQDLGSTIEDKGIIYSKKTGRPLQYRILGPTENDDVIVDAKDLVFIKEPSNHLRGIPIVSSAIRMFYDLGQSQELLLTQHLMATTMSIVEHNETGTNEINLCDSDAGTCNSPNFETLNSEGGEIRYYRANTGSKLEFLTSNNPSIEWKNYQDQLTNIAILSLNWNKALLGMGDSTGVNDRLSLQQCANTVQDRQSLLVPFLRRVCNYALAKLLKNGYITNLTNLPIDWYKCSFSKPKKLTVDFARDSKVIMEEYKSGVKNLTQILDEEGIEYEDHVRQRYTEEALRIQIKQEIEKEFGVSINELDARLNSQQQYNTPTDI